MKGDLDIKRLEAFAKHFQEIDDDGVVSCSNEFLKYFPSRKEQAREFMRRAFEEVIIPYAKKVIAESESND